jgi:formate hydrogenlyase subunit 3/multisubunit Na+/H+ antiporter MnhD subunit
MSEVFWVIALLLLGISVLLAAAGDRKLLNFVDYGAAQSATRINRHAAARMLLPVVVNAGCAWIAATRPQLAVPLLFLTPVSILCAVVWIAAGMQRLGKGPDVRRVHR